MVFQCKNHSEISTEVKENNGGCSLFLKDKSRTCQTSQKYFKGQSMPLPRLGDTESKRDYILIFPIQKRLISLQGCILFSAKFNKLWLCINEILKRK